MTAGLVGQSQITTFTTPVNGTSPIDANQVRGNDNTIKTSYDAHDSDGTIHFQSSLAGARPAAGTAGRKWIDSDTLRVYYDNGVTWDEIAYASSGGGTIAGNVHITGTLLVDGATTIDDTLTITGIGTFADASGWKATTADAGMYIAAGQLALGTYTGSGAEIKVNLSTHLVTFSGAATFGGVTTSTRSIASADITSAVAKGTFSDGTALNAGDASIARILGLVSTIATADATNGTDLAHFYAKQTAATAANIKAISTVVEASHTSGVVALAIGELYTAFISGSGGTTTRLDLVRAGGGGTAVSAGATVTTFSPIHITNPTVSGTVTTLAGLDIENLTSGGTNYSIRTGTAQCLFGGALQVNGVTTVVDNLKVGSPVKFEVTASTGQVTASGLVQTTASTTSTAGLNLPHGAAPTAPVNGDLWTTTAGLFVRINGVTVGPLS